MREARRSVSVAVALLALAASTSQAETTTHGDGRRFGLGFGLGSGSMAVGSETGGSFEAAVAGRIGLDARNRFLAIGEVTVRGVANPVADESFRAVNALLGWNIGRRFKVRPCVGWQFRFWSGSQRVESDDSGPAVGVDLGPELRVGSKLTLSPEAVFRYSPIEIEGSVRGRFIGVQVVASF